MLKPKTSRTELLQLHQIQPKFIKKRLQLRSPGALEVISSVERRASTMAGKICGSVTGHHTTDWSVDKEDAILHLLRDS